jgi:hypothetical protein
MSLVLPSQSVSVHGDRGRLEQVLSNLLSNAMKFGAGRPVEIRLEHHGSVARLSVSDHGIGIDLASFPHLFGRFERGARSLTTAVSAWACTSAARSSRPTTAPSGCTAARTRAPPSRSSCPCSTPLRTRPDSTREPS